MAAEAEAAREARAKVNILNVLIATKLEEKKLSRGQQMRETVLMNVSF